MIRWETPAGFWLLMIVVAVSAGFPLAFYGILALIGHFTGWQGWHK